MNFQAPLLTTVNADRAILFAGTDWLYLSFYVSKGQNLLFSLVGEGRLPILLTVNHIFKLVGTNSRYAALLEILKFVAI